MDANLKTAMDALHSALTNNGYVKEAAELLAIQTTQAPPRQVTQDRGTFQEERPPQQPQNRQLPGAIPLPELDRILKDIESQQYFRYLPKKVLQGIYKVRKMIKDSARYASEKEAFFGGKKDPVRVLQEYLFDFSKSSPTSRAIPDDIKRALNNLNALVSQHVARLPKEKTVLEKGQEFARGMAEKGKGFVQDVAEKGQQFKQKLDEKKQLKEEEQTYKTMKNFEDNLVVKEREDEAISSLKEDLRGEQHYPFIFKRLPGQIKKVLENIGLGVDDLSNLGTIRLACHINNTLLHYIRTKEAYSSKELNMGIKEEKEHSDVYRTFAKAIKGKKRQVPLTIREFAEQVAKAHLKEDPKYYTKLKGTFKSAMDFSGIGNMITPDGSLDERELARVIRLAISAELDAVHLYELIVDTSKDDMVKRVLQSISNEEKVHVGELQELLTKFDSENEKFLEEGKKEVKSI